MRSHQKLVLLAALGAVTLAMPAVAAPETAEPAACLARPQGAAPAGKHWYYHIDRPSRRQCWYVGEAGAKTMRPVATKQADDNTDQADDDASAPPQSAATPPQPAPAMAVQPPVADAHAELIAPASAPTAPAASNAAAPVPLDATPDVTGGMTPRAWSLATRWQEATAPSSDADGSNTAAAPPQSAQTQSADAAPQAVAPAAAPTPSDAAAAASTAPAPAENSQENSNVDYLFVALCTSVLAFGTVLALLILRAAWPNRDVMTRLARQVDPRPHGEAAGAPVVTKAVEQNRRARAPRSAAQPQAARPLRPFAEEIDELERLLSNARTRSVLSERPFAIGR